MTPSRDPADAGEPTDPALPLSESQEREVASLLADAVGRGPATPPPEVVTRLDDVLAGLVAERAAQGARPHRNGATVVPLAERRRRLPRVLLAAAAVVVGGYAVGNAALDGSLAGDGLEAGSADSAGGGSEGDTDAQADGAEAPAEGLAGDDGMSLLPTVRPDHLDTDVRRVVRLFGQLPVARGSEQPSEDGAEGPGAGSGGGIGDELGDCRAPRLTDRQRLYQVRYGGEPAGLVVGARRGGRLDVTVYSCRTGEVEVTRVVPAP